MTPKSHPLHRLFRGLTESTFMTELGIGDPSLVGYVADLLASFVPSQMVWRLRDKQGRPIVQVTRMVAEAESANDDRRRSECHRHVGDFTLFWTGVYPEALGRLQGSESPDCLISYQQQGKRSYYLASTLSTADDRGSVLRRLSDEFELCAFGLSRVRREWEKIESDGSAATGDDRADVGLNSPCLTLPRGCPDPRQRPLPKSRNATCRPHEHPRTIIRLSERGRSCRVPPTLGRSLSYPSR